MVQLSTDLLSAQRRSSSAREWYLSALSLALFGLFAIAVLVNAAARPIANWDMLPYTALALPGVAGMDAASQHAATYDLVRQKVSEAQWAELTAVGRYRIAQAQSAQAFASMLPMYEVKQGYILAVRAAAHWVDPVTAMRAMSMTGAIALFAALAWGFWRLRALPLLALTIPVMSALDVGDQASLCGPDTLSNALTLWAVALILVRGARRPPRLALGLLVSAVALRPDMLVATTGLPFALIVGAALAALARGEAWVAALGAAVRQVGAAPWLAMLAGMAVYMAVKTGVDHPGWWAHFSFSFVEQKESMAGPHGPFDLRVYVTALARVSMRLIRTETWPWIVVALAFGGLLWLQMRDLSATLMGVLLFVAGVLASRYLAFPLPDARIATPWVLSLVMTLAACAAPALGRQSMRPHVA